MMKLKHICIRCDSSDKIGFGHVMRCIALAQKCSEFDIVVSFLMQAHAIKGIELIQSLGWHVEQLIPGNISETRHLQQIQDYIETKQAQCLLIDHYEYETEAFAFWQNRTWQLVVLDDIAERNLSSTDLIINPNLLAERYESLYPAQSQKLLGLKYCLLRQEFKPFRNHSSRIGHSPLRIILTMGGSDTRKWYLPILDALLAYSIPLEITVLASFMPDQVQVQSLQNIAYTNRHRLSFEPFRNNPVELYQWADLAITAAGSSIWEFSYLGIPMMVTDIADNQKGIVQAIGQDLFYLGEWHPRIGETVISSLNQIINRPQELQIMSHKISQWVDGQGSERILLKINDMLIN